MLSEDPHFLTSLLEQLYSLLIRHIKTLSFMDVHIEGRLNVVTNHNLLNLGSIPGVAATLPLRQI